MSACEKCWADAQRARFGGGDPRLTVVDHYYRLLGERADHPCSAFEQKHGYCERPAESHDAPLDAPAEEKEKNDV